MIEILCLGGIAWAVKELVGSRVKHAKWTDEMNEHKAQVERQCLRRGLPRDRDHISDEVLARYGGDGRGQR